MKHEEVIQIQNKDAVHLFGRFPIVIESLAKLDEPDNSAYIVHYGGEFDRSLLQH